MQLLSLTLYCLKGSKERWNLLSFSCAQLLNLIVLFLIVDHIGHTLVTPRSSCSYLYLTGHKSHSRFYSKDEHSKNNVLPSESSQTKPMTIQKFVLEFSFLYLKLQKCYRERRNLSIMKPSIGIANKIIDVANVATWQI
uniref:Uncharacterized protein n=1 Tax=Cacopsylla melanoneura TaxID=428564 RepID=A0A8D8YPI4_9HEMI